LQSILTDLYQAHPTRIEHESEADMLAKKLDRQVIIAGYVGNP